MTIEAVMHVALGFLVAAFALFLILPAYKRRTVRLTSEAIKRSMPLTEAEIRADKDRLRADYVLAIHELESKLEKATLAHARQRVEINRRDAAISGLEGDIERMRGSLEEHENAHRVLEQTIMDRLPRVESRLAEARRLILQRDREIAQLSQTAQMQAKGLEEANQINTKNRDEILRLNAALATRTARGRDSYGDDRQDGEVALRTEIEALRAKTREQSSMVARLQGLLGRTGARVGIGGEGIRFDADIAGAGTVGGDDEPLGLRSSDEEIARLRSALAQAEATLSSLQSSADVGSETMQRLKSEIAGLRTSNEDKDAELRRLSAELMAYKDAERDDKGLREGKTAMRAKIASLDSQTREQTEIIQRLRAEIAAANERTARQAAHFTEELRRLGAGTYQTSASPRRTGNEPAGRRSLTDRINEVGPIAARSEPGGRGQGHAARSGDAPVDRERASGFMRALGGGNGRGSDGPVDRSARPAMAASASLDASSEVAGEPVPETAEAVSGAEAPKPTGNPTPRRGGLLERITRADRSD
ncbi:MAG: hypothetical protein K0U74_12810 [Alphaproteobacteria bacterium]|nr:hypothetical protein [Alphaproteobacteria bacterium]